MKQCRLLLITDLNTHPPFDDTVYLYTYLSSQPDVALFHVNPEETLNAPCIHCVHVQPINSFEQFKQIDRQLSARHMINSFDLIVHRADKPFPPHFLENLEKFETDARFLNSPCGLRQVSNRAFARHFFPELLPPGIVSDSVQDISSFLSEHRHVVLKTNTSYGGKEVFQVQPHQNDSWKCEGLEGPHLIFESQEKLLSWFFTKFRSPFECVRFLKKVGLGDKRIVVVGGEIYGAFTRKGAKGSWINNITAGGRAEPSTVLAEEREIVEKTYPLFESRKVYTLGYDFLVNDNGSWILSEINAGNVGGFVELSEMNNKEYIKKFAEWILIRANQTN